MPIPFALGLLGAAAGLTGVGSAIKGAVEMKEANDTMKAANERHEGNLKRFKIQNGATTSLMDDLGKLELEILDSFEEFSNILEKIQSRPKFRSYSKNGVHIPQYSGEEIRQVSVGAGALLGSIGGAATGTAGGFAAAGATSAAVMVLGTASTGTAISSLSGAALTNATLAALGGGSLAAGGGGIALGTTILGATTLGVGLLVGGIIFSVTGKTLSDKADEAWDQMLDAEKEINTACDYMKKLSCIAGTYCQSLRLVNDVYRDYLQQLKEIVIKNHKTNWNRFDSNERLITENTVLLVGLLFNMCKVKLVLISDEDKKDGLNEINELAVNRMISDAERVMIDNGFQS